MHRRSGRWPVHRRQSLHRAHRRRQASRLASGRHRSRKSAGHHAHAGRARGDRRRRSRSSRGWCRARDGRWWTTRRGRCSTRRISDFCEGEKSPWPWVMERPANEARHSDWYFFGYGHDYARRWAIMCAWRGGFRCRRGLRSARGGRATGRTATRNSTSWCTDSARMTRRWMCW